MRSDNVGRRVERMTTLGFVQVVILNRVSQVNGSLTLQFDQIVRTIDFKGRCAIALLLILEGNDLLLHLNRM